MRTTVTYRYFCMAYLDDLKTNSTEGIVDLVKDSIAGGLLTIKQVEEAVEAEVNAALIESQFYELARQSQLLLKTLHAGPDKFMVTVVKKILKSTKLASHTFRDPSEIEYQDQPLFGSDSHNK